MIHGPYHIMNGLNNADPKAAGQRYILGYEGPYPRRIAKLGNEGDFDRQAVTKMLELANRQERGLLSRIFSR